MAAAAACQHGPICVVPPCLHGHGTWVGGSWLSLTENLCEVAALGFPLVLAPSKFGSTRVCTELEVQGSMPFLQRLTRRLFVLRLNTGRMVLFLFGFKI